MKQQPLNRQQNCIKNQWILLVEQNVNQALKIADYGYVLTSGKIFLSGTYDELYKEEKVRDMYLGEGQYVRRSKLWQA